MRRLRQRPALSTLGVVGVVLVLAAFGPPLDVVGGSAGEEPDRNPSEVKILSVSERSDARLWPYTSRRKRFDSLTLPINVVVRGDPSRLRAILTGSTAAERNGAEEWHGPPPARRLAGDPDPWYAAHGSTRYTFVADAEGGGRWVDETAQLESGAYFGTRYHLRMYTVEGSRGSWTAIQVHHEYWDWFRLRHTVGSTARGRRHLERRFFGRPSVREVRRERYANGGISDADGWVSVVDLAGPAGAAAFLPAVVVPLTVLVRRARRVLLVCDRLLPGVRESRPSLRLFVGVAAVPPLVRHGSIALAGGAPWMPAKVIAATGYPILAVGVPLVAFHAARGLAAERSFVTGAVALATGLFPDYVLIGVDALPVGLVLHRLTLMVAVGLVAAGSEAVTANRDVEVLRRRCLLAGVGLWVTALVWPLVFGY